MSDNNYEQNEKTVTNESQGARGRSQQQGGGGATGQEKASNAFADMIDPRQYIGVVLQYWWLILLILILGSGAAAAYSVLSTPLYRATCRYEIFRESRLQLTDDEYRRNRAATSIEDEVNRQVVILRSGTLHQRVMERLRPKWEERLKDDELRPNVDITRLREAKTMVDIQVDSVDVEYSIEYLEEMLRAYTELRREEILESTDRAVASLRREQETISQELEAAQEALTEFQREHNLTYTQTRTWYDERFLANLVQRENALRMEQIMLESQFDFLDDADVATIQDAMRMTQESGIAASDMSNVPEEALESGELSEGGQFSLHDEDAQLDMEGMDRLQWGQDTDWQAVEARLERLRAEYEDQLSIYKPDHPKMIELNKEIEAAERDLELASEIALKRLRARFSAIDIQLEGLQDASKAWRQQLDLTTEQRAEHAELQSKVEHLEDLHDRVYSRILDGSVVDADALFSRVVEPVRGDEEPVWPATIRIMVLSIIASIGLGVGFAFMLDHFDTRFLDALAIEERLQVPYVSGTPDWNRVIKTFNPNGPGLMVSREKSDVSTETYRTMRAGIDYITGQAEPYVLMITSGDDGEGKTMTVLNLATLYAWSGKKTLLVDGDLRRGSCHPAFNGNREPGLCEYFTGQVSDWHDLVQDTGEENLDLISSGSYRHQVPEMLSGAGLRRLMDEWRQEYDMIVMDSAPAGRVVDTSFLGKIADGTLLVVRHGKANFGSVRHALHRLMGTNVIGFCLNGIQLGQRKYSYYSRYGRYYYGRYTHPYGEYYGRGRENEDVASASEES